MDLESVYQREWFTYMNSHLYPFKYKYCKYTGHVRPWADIYIYLLRMFRSIVIRLSLIPFPNEDLYGIQYIKVVQNFPVCQQKYKYRALYHSRQCNTQDCNKGPSVSQCYNLTISYLAFTVCCDRWSSHTPSFSKRIAFEVRDRVCNKLSMLLWISVCYWLFRRWSNLIFICLLMSSEAFEISARSASHSIDSLYFKLL